MNGDVGAPLTAFETDGTAECPECALPLFPHDRRDGAVALECANRHPATLPVPADPLVLREVDRWIARRGAQLHWQEERRRAEADPD